MPKVLKLRRGTSAQHDDFIGAAGEVTMDTTLNTLRVHDGTTPGGHRLARKLELDAAMTEKADANHSHSDITVEMLSAPAKSHIAGAGAPGSSYVSLSIAKNGEYTAPANGWFCLKGGLSSGNAWVGSSSGDMFVFNNNSNPFFVWFPAVKNQAVHLNWDGNGSLASGSCFRFYYNAGETI
jgi:hypothetical protein